MRFLCFCFWFWIVFLPSAALIAAAAACAASLPVIRLLPAFPALHALGTFFFFFGFLLPSLFTFNYFYPDEMPAHVCVCVCGWAVELVSLSASALQIPWNWAFRCLSCLPSSLRPVGNLSGLGVLGLGWVCVSVLVELQQSVHRDIPLRIALFVAAASSPRSLCPLYALINNYNISALFMAASAVYFGLNFTDFLFSSPLNSECRCGFCFSFSISCSSLTEFLSSSSQRTLHLIAGSISLWLWLFQFGLILSQLYLSFDCLQPARCDRC